MFQTARKSRKKPLTSSTISSTNNINMFCNTKVPCVNMPRCIICFFALTLIINKGNVEFYTLVEPKGCLKEAGYIHLLSVISPGNQ